jgi:PAS domain S-box-containing protein
MPSATLVRPQAGRLLLAAAIGLAAVVGLFAFSVREYVASLEWVDRTVEVRQELDEWLVALLDAETGARGYIASDRPVFLEPYSASLSRERATASRVRSLVADTLSQVHNVEVADADARAVMAELADLVGLVHAKQQEQALARLESGENKRRMDKFRLDAQEIRSEEARLLAERRSTAKSHGWLALFNASLLTLASAALLAVAWRRERIHDQRMTTLAKDARARLKALSGLAAALSETHTRSQVAEVVIEHGMRAAGADTCTLYELDSNGTALQLIADRGVAPNVLDKIRRITETEGNPGTFLAVKAGKTTWAESRDDYAKIYPALATMKSESPRAAAFWSVPLVAEGQPVGLLGAGFYGPRRFSTDEREFVESLGKHCAQALMRASRLEREDEVRRWLATTLRSIGDAVIATDAEGRVTFMNAVAETLTGWVEADARGRPLPDVFHILSEQSRAVVENPVAKVLREGAVVGLANHTMLRSKRGIEVPIDDSGAPILNDAGRILGVVLVFRDATKEKRARARSEFLAKAGEALVASIDYSSTLATVARFAVPTLADWCSVTLVETGTTGSRQVAVAHVDEDKVRFARELGERYPADPNATRGVPQVIRSGESELLADIPQAMLESSARDAEHLRMIRELQLKSAMVVPLRVRGRTLGALTFVYAESGRRYTEDDLRFAEDFARRAAMAIENAIALKETGEARAKEQRLRAEAELASRAKDDFLATVSHELRTPLNAILGWTVTLRRRKLSDDVDRALTIIERNARQQTKLIEDVLDISRIISGKLALRLGATNISEAIAAAVETVTPAAEAKGIHLHMDVPDGSLSITADVDRFQQIVWNLLSNAVKFTPKGGRVDVRAYREGSEVCVGVSDSGEGIRHEVLPLVFEPFHQADATITRRHGGLGLGLAIVKQLVTAHGGTVDAHSDGEGKGATFIVRLPALAAVAAVSRGGRPMSASASATMAELPRLDGLRLMVVDDEVDSLDVVSEVLRGQGAEVHPVTSAREALQRFKDTKPDLVVSDIGMPEMDGLSMIQRIRSLPSEEGGLTPAIALTAYARAEDAARALAAGYQTHLSKPVEPEELAAVVARLATRSSASG